MIHRFSAHTHTHTQYSTCDFVSTDSRHLPFETFHSLIERSLDPPPVASREDFQGHHETAYDKIEREGGSSVHTHTHTHMHVHTHKAKCFVAT